MFQETVAEAIGIVSWIASLFKINLKISATLIESGSHVWNRIQHGLLAGQLFFLLRAGSDTLPTPLNMKRWRLKVDSKCHLCGSSAPTVFHILNGCPVALNQSRYTWRHDSVLWKFDRAIRSNLSNGEHLLR